MIQAHSAAQSPAWRRRRLAHLIVLRRDHGHQMVGARSRSVCGPRLHQRTAYGIIRRSARLDVAVFSPPFHSRKWAALALAINWLSNGPHPSSNFRPLLAGAAHRPTRRRKVSEELKSRCILGTTDRCSTRNGRVNGCLRRSRRLRGGRGAAPLAHGHRASAGVSGVSKHDISRASEESSGWTRLVNRYFPTLRLAPSEAFVWERFWRCAVRCPGLPLDFGCHGCGLPRPGGQDDVATRLNEQDGSLHRARIFRRCEPSRRVMTRRKCVVDSP